MSAEKSSQTEAIEEIERPEITKVSQDPEYTESVKQFLASDNVSMMGGWT